MNRPSFRFFVIAALCLAAVLSHCEASAADWPMWRNGLQRNGSTAHELPETLSLRWSRQLLAPKPAWPNESRLHFDAAYEPVAADGLLFVGSMVDGSLTAFSLETGDLVWRFYSDGPIRLTPAVAEGRVYVGSDDGFLYCLAANDGKLLWKQFGAPAERGQRRHLGNNRIVSFWPVRGGPVVDDGIVYFGAGIWPTMGVFVHAADAKTGQLIWTNGNSNAIADVRVDHNYTHEGSISPQGHLLLTNEFVVVPNGRSMPARLDRKTGELQYFTQGYRNGDSRISISGDVALVGATGVVGLKDGREISSLWSKAGGKAPKSWSWELDLFESPLFPYKFEVACDHRSAIRDGIAYGIHNGIVRAYDIAKAELNRRDTEKNKRIYRPAHWEPPLKWRLPTSFAEQRLPTKSVILAGTRLYSHCGPHLIAITLPGETGDEATVAWTHKLPSTPASLIASNGRLVVSTQDGTIHCFDETDVTPISVPSPIAESTDSSHTASPLTGAILQESGAAEGFAVVLGLNDARLISDLLRDTKLSVVAVETDAHRVNQIREKLVTNGNYADRLQLITGDLNTTDLPHYMAELLIVSAGEKIKLDTPQHMKRLFEILRPYGGQACIVSNGEEQLAVLERCSPGQLPGAVVKTTDDFILLTRSGALPGAADWTHETSDAARSFFSKDNLVKAPLGVLWYGDGPGYGFYKRNDYGHGIKPQIAGGRMVVLQNLSNTLYSLDAYTGRVLWTRKVGGSARYVSMPDAVYVGDERTGLVLDAATGDVKHSHALDVDRPEDVPVSVSDVRVDRDVILVAVRFNKNNGIPKGRWNSELIICLDRETGRQLWSRAATQRFNTAAIAMANGRVYCIDSHSPEDIGTMKRRGDDVKNLPSGLLALNARTGDEIWKKETTDSPAVMEAIHFISLRARDDWLAYSEEHDLLIFGKDSHTYAVNAATGEDIWKMPKRGNQPLILGPDTFINQSGHTYDTASGKLLSDKVLFRRGGCNYAVGNKNLLFLRSNCAAYVDVESGKQFNLRNLRSGCSNSLVAADGLLNAPCFSMGCICNYPIQTSFAMRHMPETADWHGNDPLKLEPPVEPPSLEE